MVIHNCSINMKREFVFDLLRISLSNGIVEDVDKFGSLDNDLWEGLFRFISMHGVAALVYHGIERIPQDFRPTGSVLMKFIGANVAARRTYAKLNDVVEKIDEVIKQGEIKCLLLKGFTLAEYYPNPELRQFLDVDLYAPDASYQIDKVFMTKGVNVDTGFYRHSHMTLAGVLVENHHCLLDVRGRKLMTELDADLKSMALEHLSKFGVPGLYYPDAQFSLIFNLHHAMSHFIYEGISFKFLVDWIYFLRQERELLTTDQMSLSLKRHGLLRFAAVMSDVCVRYLGLSLEDVPEYIRMEIDLLKQSVVDKFIDDLFRPYEKVHKKSILTERFNNVVRIIKASWKPKEFLDQSAAGFIWEKFLPIMMGKKYEAD